MIHIKELLNRKAKFHVAVEYIIPSTNDVWSEIHAHAYMNGNLNRNIRLCFSLPDSDVTYLQEEKKRKNDDLWLEVIGDVIVVDSPTANLWNIVIEDVHWSKI